MVFGCIFIVFVVSFILKLYVQFTSRKVTSACKAGTHKKSTMWADQVDGEKTWFFFVIFCASFQLAYFFHVARNAHSIPIFPFGINFVTILISLIHSILWFTRSFFFLFFSPVQAKSFNFDFSFFECGSAVVSGYGWSEISCNFVWRREWIKKNIQNLRIVIMQ